MTATDDVNFMKLLITWLSCSNYFAIQTHNIIIKYCYCYCNCRKLTAVDLHPRVSTATVATVWCTATYTRRKKFLLFRNTQVIVNICLEILTQSLACYHRWLMHVKSPSQVERSRGTWLRNIIQLLNNANNNNNVILILLFVGILITSVVAIYNYSSRWSNHVLWLWQCFNKTYL